MAVEYDKVPFGPKTEEEALLFAEEEFRVDVQETLHELSESSGLSRKEVADKLGWRLIKLENMFSDESFVSAGNVAAICHVLGYEPVFTARKRI